MRGKMAVTAEMLKWSYKSFKKIVTHASHYNDSKTYYYGAASHTSFGTPKLQRHNLQSLISHHSLGCSCSVKRTAALHVLILTHVHGDSFPPLHHLLGSIYECEGRIRFLEFEESEFSVFSNLNQRGWWRELTFGNLPPWDDILGYLDMIVS